MNYEQKMIQLKRRRNAIYSRCIFWHDAFLKDYRKSLWAYSAEEREDFKTYAKSDYWIYQDMRTKLRQINNYIWFIQKRELLRKHKLLEKIKRIINEKN